MVGYFCSMRREDRGIQMSDGNSVTNKLKSVFEEIEEQLKAILSRKKQEIEKDLEDEIQKEKPNVTRLRSLLTTVGSSIQVVSSLKPAYETLKQALTFIGVSLP